MHVYAYSINLVNSNGFVSDTHEADYKIEPFIESLKKKMPDVSQIRFHTRNYDNYIRICLSSIAIYSENEISDVEKIIMDTLNELKPLKDYKYKLTKMEQYRDRTYVIYDGPKNASLSDHKCCSDSQYHNEFFSMNLNDERMVEKLSKIIDDYSVLFVYKDGATKQFVGNNVWKPWFVLKNKETGVYTLLHNERSYSIDEVSKLVD